MSDNPYAPPKADVGVSAAGALPDASPYLRLYSQNQIALAALLGSPVAGGWLMAINYRHVSRWDIAGQVLGRSIGLGLVVVAIGYFLPWWLTLVVTGVMSAIGYRAWSGHQFSGILQRHREAGGELYPWWRAAGIGVLCLVMMLIVQFIASELISALLRQLA